MEIRKASPEEFEAVRAFYHALIDAVRDRTDSVGWQKDVYPAPDFLRSSLAAGELYLAAEGARIAGAMVLNHACNESCRNCAWQTEAADDELFVIHALGVHPDFERRGYAKALVQSAIDLGCAQGMKAIRLDVLVRNVAAARLYEGFGFRHMATLPMFYEDTGWTDFMLYELLL